MTVLSSTKTGACRWDRRERKAGKGERTTINSNNKKKSAFAIRKGQQVFSQQ